ncbi:SusC/RagA family TonB-linked outer membrane protein [Bacteroides sp. KG68]|uniref:SusC/RagA family TonB-linked outer membrane protein n=1 Tax=unclassified Bacteroides TaxID=2646097 RepID=UPI003D961A19
MKQRATLFLLLTLFCSLLPMQAQTGGQVTGKTADAMGELPGVSVAVKGTANGTVTGPDGSFKLDNVKPTDILQFSFIGYKTQEITAGNRKVFNITMQEDAQALEEVVVVAVGYGDVKRRDLTGSIGKANMGDLTKTPVNNVAETLGGRIAGVQVSSTDGGLGDNYSIVIRGAGSLTQSTAPLYVIDGFPSETSGMSALNPNDIESIDVLKDASATAIYGSRGANGVVIITTKKGKMGKATLTYNGSITMSNVKNPMSLMNGYDFVGLQKEIMEGNTKEVDGQTVDEFAHFYLKDGITLEDYKKFKSYDWQDEIYRTAVSHNHHMALSGGSDKMNYSASLSYSNQQGVIINSDLSRYQGRFNFSQRINKRIKIDANANFASNVQGGANPSAATSGLTNSLMYSVWGYRPVSPSGSDLLAELYDNDIDMSNDYRFNPVLSARNEYRRNTTNHLQANLGVEWEIIKNLKFKTTVGYTGRDIKREEFNGSQTRTGNTHPKNTQSKGINAFLGQTETRNYLNENTLTYVHNRKRHNTDALLGATFQKYTSYYSSITQEQITNESFGMSGIGKGSAAPVVSASQGENAMVSYLGRVRYNYDAKYYLTASMRTDGSSKFAPKNRWGYFPSGSLAWAFGREEFITQALPWLSNGKLRASWGLTGNNRIGDFDYMAQLVTSSNVYKYPWNSAFHPGYVLGSMANEKLKWETTEQYNFGLDLGFFDGRINLTLDYYIKTTKDLLLSADVPASSGYSSATLNVGKLRNKGFEMTLETTNVKTKNFTWTSSFNIAFNKNEILELNDGQESMISYINWDNKYRTMPAYISRKGEAAGKMYGFVYDGTYKYDDFNTSTDANGKTVYKLKDDVARIANDVQPGDPKYRKLTDDGTNKITDADRTVIGNGHPKHTGGFSNNFTYKNWDLNIFMQWSYGNDLLNANRLIFENPQSRKNANMFASYNNRWTAENPNSDMPRARAIGAEYYSSLYIEDGSYLKLKTISLGYNFTRKTLRSLGISAARIFASAENIATITGYSGSDPEVSTRNSVLTPGFDWSAYPRSFNASLGVNITF